MLLVKGCNYQDAGSLQVHIVQQEDSSQMANSVVKKTAQIVSHRLHTYTLSILCYPHAFLDLFFIERGRRKRIEHTVYSHHTCHRDPTFAAPHLPSPF